MTAPATRLIAVIGAESTGKSTLVAQLQRQLGGVVVPEVLRTFCQEHGRVPLAHEQSQIIERQLACELEALASNPPWLWVDSSPLMVAIYSVHYFADTSLLTRALSLQRRYSATLVTSTDLPWQADGLYRDSPEVQAWVNQYLLSLLASQHMPHHVVSGQNEQRFASALSAVLVN